MENAIDLAGVNTSKSFYISMWGSWSIPSSQIGWNWLFFTITSFRASQAKRRSRGHALFSSNSEFRRSAALLQRIIEHPQINGYSLFALHLKESDAFVGWCGLMKVPFSAHFSPAVEIGWRLNKIFWGKGLAPEAAKSVLRFGFLELGLSEIVSFTAELNQPFIWVMQKLWMKCNPEDTFNHPKLPSNHTLQSLILNRLQKTDWLDHHEISEIPWILFSSLLRNLA